MPDLKTAASVSIVVPFHNEEPNVIEMYWRLHAVMEAAWPQSSVRFCRRWEHRPHV